MTSRRNPLAVGILTSLALLATAPAFAQSTTNNSDTDKKADAAKNVGKVTVTGSRIKRSEVEGPAPVTVITADQIQREGFTTVYEALETLTQASGSTQNELVQNGFTPNATVINLRGMGPGRTLLLINGRRAADYPLPYNGQSNFANYGNIPAAAVERIEVLAGGASAIYGSDAVAGVVNVILRKNYSGDVLKASVSTTERSGDPVTDVQWIGGKTGDTWSVTYAFEKYDRPEMYAYQRKFMDSLLDNPMPPAFVGVQPTGTMRVRDRTKSTNNYFAPPAGACEQFGDELVRWNYRTANAAGVISNLGQSCGTFKDVGYQTIRNKTDDLSAYFYATKQLTDNVELWGSLQGWRSNAKSGGGTQFWGGPTVGAIWYDPSFRTYVDAQRVFTPQETGGAANLMSTYKERSADLAVGLRGTLADRWDWDFTVGHARYETTTDRYRLLANKVNEFFLGQRQGTQGGYPVYTLNRANYYRALTPEEFMSLNTIIHTEAESKVSQASLTVSGNLVDLPAGPLGMAAVIEGSNQAYTLTADPRILPTYTGTERIYNLTGTGGGGKRNRYAIGTEFNVPLTKNLNWSIAGRIDKYDDVTAVDLAKTWNTGLEFRPTKNLLLRASYATSFRAPDMHFVFAERSGSFSGIFDVRRCLEDGKTDTSCGNDPRYSYTAFGVRQGTRSLEEEAGKSWTAGFVWDLAEGISLTADYYDIRLTGAVSDITSAYILEGEAGCITGKTRTGQPFTLGEPGSAFCNDMLSRIDRLSAPGTTSDGQISEIRRGPINRAYLGTTGIDATLRIRAKNYWGGTFGWDLSWNNVLTQKSAQFAGDPIYDYRDDLGNFDFRSRVRSTWTLVQPTWDLSLFMLRQGSLPNWQETGRVQPFTTWNAGFGKRITPNFKVSVGVNNIFDRLHPEDSGFNSYPYFWRAFDPMGRSYRLSLEYKFN